MAADKQAPFLGLVLNWRSAARFSASIACGVGHSSQPIRACHRPAVLAIIVDQSVPQEPAVLAIIVDQSVAQACIVDYNSQPERDVALAWL